MTKLPPFSTPDLSDDTLREPSADTAVETSPEPPKEPVMWSRSQVSFAPLTDPRLDPKTNAPITSDDSSDLRRGMDRGVEPGDLSATAPNMPPVMNLAPTSFERVETGPQPILEVAEDGAVEPDVEVEIVAAPSKPPSLFARLKARIDESLPDDLPAARKPFVMGLLTGIVLMLLLGQIFRATQPETDFSALPSPTAQSSSLDKPVAFIDTVPNTPPQ